MHLGSPPASLEKGGSGKLRRMSSSVGQIQEGQGPPSNPMRWRFIPTLVGSERLRNMPKDRGGLGVTSSFPLPMSFPLPHPEGKDGEAAGAYVGNPR